MINEFRAAFQELLDAAVAQSPNFRSAMHEVFRLSSQVPQEERILALDALAPVMRQSEPVAGIAADLAVLAGALVEAGAPAGPAGVEVMRQLGDYGKAAGAFLMAWEETGGGTPPPPMEVTEAEEQRVAAYLNELARLATTGWWVSHRYGLAAKTVLNDTETRAALRSDPGTLQEMTYLEELTLIARQLAAEIQEYQEVHELLRMAAADSALVLDRASGRGFRVRFDGVADNFQLHTLLADALIGTEGRGVPGTRPHPSWVAASQDRDNDPQADIVTGAWDLVGGDGSWVGNEPTPADIPVIDGQRVLLLEAPSLPHSWRAGRRHPHIVGWLRVEEEISPDEAAGWWARLHPAGTVRHPLSPAPAEPTPAPANEPQAATPEPASFEEPNSPVEYSVPAPEGEPAAVEPEAPLAWEPPADNAQEVPAAAEEPSPAHDNRVDAESTESANDVPPGAGLLPPLPPGVSDSAGWAPAWK
ncbi:hypothetical protein CDO52_15195 [Nocardiopsis gilva YIM 90087]|uniref:Uncharacterized protein n=1 Tax=Nocardiopsis gilva YIM 90087 TaxID=1235441 RepID=A0A223S747_9ACTN|nr:hypothetical protein [Nocardiopsis gilva]ASU83948.1 hypothetical protein CDO52_15195 [Nocardiopsis gilva YIM 90087]